MSDEIMMILFIADWMYVGCSGIVCAAIIGLQLCDVQPGNYFICVCSH